MHPFLHKKNDVLQKLSWMTAVAAVFCVRTVCFAVSPSPAVTEVSMPAADGAAGTLVMSGHDAGDLDREDVFSLELPAFSWDGAAPFDFHIDPERLIEETGAARYGGGFVEAGATLLFHNAEGPYQFSSTSDRLRVKNSGTVPAVVTVEARIEGLNGVVMTDSYYFNDEQCSIYLALVDDRGAELPIPSDGVVTQDVMIYAYETYAFGLTGTCNPLADWSGTDASPMVSVTWRVEPVMDPEEDAPEGESLETDHAETGEAEETAPVSPEGSKDASVEETGTDANRVPEPVAENPLEQEDTGDSQEPLATDVDSQEESTEDAGAREGLTGEEGVQDELTGDMESYEEEKTADGAESPVMTDSPAPESIN